MPSDNVDYLSQCLETKAFDVSGCAKYAQGLKPQIEASIAYCANTQVAHRMAVLDEWKQLLGEDWDKTYEVTNSLYVRRTNNIMFTFMAQYFGKRFVSRLTRRPG
ncbi:MAG: hypothetical protein WBG36_07670 [Ornithinimicrobium sp.]